MYMLRNKKILITGGSKGIGKEIIILMLRKGAEIHNMSLEKTDIENENLHEYEVDLLKEIPILKCNDFDIVVLNVAKNPGIKCFDSYSLEDIDNTIYLNIFVHLKILKTFSYKKIVFINSICSFTGLPEFSIYCATKSFMCSINESLRREGKDTYIIFPYKVNTEMFSEMKDFFTIDKTYLAKLIVSDIENGTKERVVPFIFSLTLFIKSFTPNFIFDLIIKMVNMFFKKK